MNLKRTLSLVLVIVMVLGLFGIASATSFKDDTTIQYKEAVDVMTGIGAINGYPADNTFRPTGTITRAEAAKMIAYAVLGADVASTLAGTASNFPDVDANYAWAIPSIQYLVMTGAINGYPDGTFGPEGQITGYEIAKILLVCLGIDGDFTGIGWDLNVALAASKVGLFDGRTDNASALSVAATREEAALYCFNTITYSPAAGTKTETWYLVSATSNSSGRPTGIIGETYPSIAEATAAATADNVDAQLGNNYTLTPVTLEVANYAGSIGANVYGLKSLSRTALNGLYGHEWAKGKNSTVFSDFYVDDVFVASFAKGTAYKAMANAVGVDYTNTKGAKWYANGVLDTTLTSAQVNGLLTSSTAIETGVTVYVSAQTGDYKMMATYEYLAKVKSVTNDSLTGFDTVVFTVYAGAESDVTMGTAAKIAKGTFKKDDYYLVVPLGDSSSAATLLSIKAPTTVDGKVTGTGTGYIRVDGKQFVIGANNKQLGAAIDYNSTTFTFYLDSAGDIVGYQVQSVSTTTFDGYIYVAAEEYKVVDPSSNPLSGAVYSAVAKANIFVPGGSAQTVDLATYKHTTAAGTTETYLGTSTSGALLTADGTIHSVGITGWCAYIDTGAGYVLIPMVQTSAATDGTADVTLRAGSAAVIPGKYADANTVVNVFSFNSTTKAATSASYTGTANYPGTAKLYENANYTIVVSYDTTYPNLVKSISIFDTTVSTQAVNYAVYVGAGEAYESGKFYQGFYVGGEYVEYKLATDVTLPTTTEGTLYNITLNASGDISAATELNAGAGLVSGTVGYVGATYIVVGGNIYYYGTGYASYDATDIANGVLEADTVSSGDTVSIHTVTSGGVNYAGIALITTKAP